MGWQQGHPQPPLLRLLLLLARDRHSDPKQLLRIPHQPAKEHPTAPFVGLVSVQQTFLGGLGLGKDV